MLYIKNPNTESLYALIKDFFLRASPHTYHDKECNHWHCYGTKRSFGDTFEMANTYFLECTKKDVAKVMVDLINQKQLTGWYCSTVNKWVYFYGNYEYDINYRNKSFDCISWNELMELGK